MQDLTDINPADQDEPSPFWPPYTGSEDLLWEMLDNMSTPARCEALYIHLGLT